VKRFRAGVLIAVLSVSIIAVGCGRSGSDSSSDTTSKSGSNISANCKKEALKASEIGVTADTISVEVMADTGSPLAPGLFQGNVDALNAYAKYINANGGIGCRQMKVEAWDSKLDATESKNGIINGCKNDLAMVGGNSLFNPDVSVIGNCADMAGQPVGLPVFSALANDVNEQCHPNVWVMQAVAEACNGTTTGVRDLKAFVGATKYYKTIQPNLKGIFLVPGDLPTTVQSATYQIEGQKQAGVTWTDALKVSGRSEQSAFNTYVQALKNGGGNYAYMGSNDVAMTKLRKEAAAQGLTGVDVWPVRWPATPRTSRPVAPQSTAPMSGCSSFRSKRHPPTRPFSPMSTLSAASPTPSVLRRGSQQWPSPRRSTRSSLRRVRTPLLVRTFSRR